MQYGCNDEEAVNNLYKSSTVLLTRQSACSDHDLSFAVLVHCSSLSLSTDPDPWYAHLLVLYSIENRRDYLLGPSI